MNKMLISSGARTVYAPRPRTLTKQRLKILKFIDKYMKGHGYAPSDTEIREVIGVKSRSWTRQQCLTLQEFECIEYYGSRQIRVLEIPKEVKEKLEAISEV